MFRELLCGHREACPSPCLSVGPDFPGNHAQPALVQMRFSQQEHNVGSPEKEGLGGGMAARPVAGKPACRGYNAVTHMGQVVLDQQH